MEPQKTPKCPICKKPSVKEYRPFCSKRCADIDLAHWLRGDYTIEGTDKTETDQEKDHEAEED